MNSNSPAYEKTNFTIEHRHKIELCAQDSHTIPLFYFSNTLSKQNPKAVIQIVHGMCEHHVYFKDFITYFNNLGYDIYIHDQRGHGQAVHDTKDLGYIAEKDGWKKLISDGILVSDYIKQNHPNKSLILFGHSMGALVSQAMVINCHKQNKNIYDQLILTGSPGDFPSIICEFGKFLVKFEILLRGCGYSAVHATSPIGKLLVNKIFNYSFRKEGKRFAWATRDQIWLDKILADERAGFIPKNQFWLDLIDLLQYIKNYKNIATIHKDFSILLFDGAHDPINNKTRLTKNLIKRFNSLGITKTKHFIYPHTRHHLCIEINRQDFFHDLQYNLLS